jgi:two-component system chemotaxis response regulator CheY
MINVLIVDDSKFVRNSIKKMLISGNYGIAGEAEDGIMAIEQYFSLQPDFVIMDIMMPRMNGIDAIKEIKKRDPKSKIVVCSSLHQEKVIQEATEAGALDFLFKPFEMTELTNLIQKHST